MHQPSHRRFTRAPLVPLLLLAPILMLVGCSRNLGYGVLLWSQDEEQVPSGSVVNVVSQSDLQDTYQIRITQGSEELSIPRWRVRLFSDEEEAVADAQAYADLATVYARSARNALPMRSEPSLDSDNIVYRLRSGETIKLVSRDEEPSDLSGLVSYWYSALTQTGISAYVFGYQLELFDALDPEAEFEDVGPEDPLMEMLLGCVWRPIYFVDMIVNRAYDLDLFQPQYGLFPDPEARTLTLVLPYHTVVFNYERIANVGARRYLAEGTNLQITFNRGDELSLQYQYEGRQYILALQRIEGDIQQYVDTELERRQSTYENILERGPAFSSGNYGDITLLEDGRFIWTGYERLVPAAIPSGLGTGGHVELDLYLGAELRGTYDGAIAFRFDGNREPVVFAYKLVPDGIRMIFIPPDDIDEYMVTGSGVSSITLFFSTVGG